MSFAYIVKRIFTALINSSKSSNVILTINADRVIPNKEESRSNLSALVMMSEKSAKAVKDSPLPNEYADILRKEYWPF